MRTIVHTIRLFVSIAFLFGAEAVSASRLKDALSNTETAGNRAGAGGMGDLGTVVGTGIQVALSLVGMIFLVLMVYAGFLWMTARGDEEQVKKARNIIVGTLIGLVIVISAYAISILVGANFS